MALVVCIFILNFFILKEEGRMGQKWQDYKRAAERGPMAIAVKVILSIFVFGVLISVIVYGLGWFGETARVTQEEFGPRAMLEKYEWFKDAAAQLEKKQADITVYDGRITTMNFSVSSSRTPPSNPETKGETKMKKTLAVLVSVVMLGFFAGCTPPPQSASGVGKAEVKVPTGPDGLTAEQRNIRERLVEDIAQIGMELVKRLAGIGRGGDHPDLDRGMGRKDAQDLPARVAAAAKDVDS